MACKPCFGCGSKTHQLCGYCPNCQNEGWKEGQALDYLIDLALQMRDKLWFEKLVQEKRRLTE
jgi:IDEAL domain